MAKSNIGGRRATSIPRASTQASTPQVDNTTQATAFTSGYTNFMAMSDDDKADYIESALSKGLPKHLANTALQKLIYHSDMNDAPDVVPDAQLDQMNGTELFRTVNSFTDTSKRMKWSAPEVAEQLQYADVTRVGAGGGTRFGEGLYFADDFVESQLYGSSRNDINNTATIRAKLNSNAKVMMYSKAVQDAHREIASGSKLGQALRKADPDSRPAIYALSRGYNVISGGQGYYVVLNRRAMTVSSTIKAREGKTKW